VKAGERMAASQPRKVPLKERALIIGNVIGINAHRADRVLLKQRFAEGGYKVHETEHFLLFTREKAPSMVVAHWFAPEAIDAQIGHYFIEELKPFGVVECSEDLSNLFGVVVGSLNPLHVRLSWRLYADNTIERYRNILEGKGKDIVHQPINEFAAIYKRVLQLLVGDTVLDAGCSFGFLPLLIAEYAPSIKQIVGVDILTNSFAIVGTIAQERHFKHVEFKQADLLSDEFGACGNYDNVLALHVLEHFTETEMYRVLANLLKVTARRLIIAVPYEPGEVESAHGHKQLFTPTKLESIRQWSKHHCRNANSIWCEDCAGGLLILDKQASAATFLNARHP
jgi:2-polyprenyl-3-methyl-5-hydroxy-6-metoxy-1,4-benzoquinol methylase